MELWKDDKFWKGQAERLLFEPDRSFFDKIENKKMTDFKSTASGIYRYFKFDGLTQEDLVEKYGSSGAERYISDRLESARGSLSGLLNAKPENIFFETGGYRAALHPFLTLDPVEGGEVITTDNEYVNIERVPGNFTRKEVPVDDVVQKMYEEINDDTRAIMASQVTHDTCRVIPVKEISDLAEDYGVPFVLDSAQAVGQMQVDLEELGAYSVSSSSQKWLWSLVSGIIAFGDDQGAETSRDVLSPWQLSYDTNGNHKGTFPGRKERALGEHYGMAIQIAHLSKCLEEHEKWGWENEFKRIEYVGDKVRECFSEIPGVYVPKHEAPGMIPVRTDNTKEHSKALQNKHLVMNSYKEKKDLMRFSTSAFNTMNDVDRLGHAMKSVTSGSIPDDSSFYLLLRE